jgi:hypothetical protein
MRRCALCVNRKVAGAIFLVPLGAIRGIVDRIGEVQTVNDLPVIKWLIHPYFSLAAFSGAVWRGGWAYYDFRIKKEQAGFLIVPEKKNRYRRQAIIWILSALVLFIILALIYGHFHRKVVATIASTPPLPLLEKRYYGECTIRPRIDTEVTMRMYARHNIQQPGFPSFQECFDHWHLSMPRHPDI